MENDPNSKGQSSIDRRCLFAEGVKDLCEIAVNLRVMINLKTLVTSLNYTYIKKKKVSWRFNKVCFPKISAAV